MNKGKTIFAQFNDRSGLRDIETTLDLCAQDLYRSGLKAMLTKENGCNWFMWQLSRTVFMTLII